MPETAFLIGVYPSSRERVREEASLEELQSLVETAGAVIADAHLIQLRTIHPATFLGEGNVAWLSEEISARKCSLLVFDSELTPTQNRNLEDRVGVKVIDRTGIILDIFAGRARSQEGKLQVELAQLEYLLPRLAGKGTEFSQLAGGIGTRGPGETKLEMDRRKARSRVVRLKKSLERVRVHRGLHREKREGVPIPVIALVGYTNAGKSTLMRSLTGADVLVEDKLFATLDPTVRRFRLPSGRDVLLADTVGFIRKLPHQLVEAFHATFEEVASADLLLHIVDVSHPDGQGQIRVVRDVLERLGLERKPCIEVWNKSDRVSGDRSAADDAVMISALLGTGLPDLLQKIEDVLSTNFRRMTLCLPHSAGREISHLYRSGRILSRTDDAEGIHLEVELGEKEFQLYRKYA